ncbi:MAG: hypothetical protein RMJ53_10555, partial [Chitinophagales bacterium]|nr:hypothetical protein [Chitinophagales bacterium]
MLIPKISSKSGLFTVSLPSSKSISNRALILKSLSKGKINIYNLSEAEDTVKLKHLLQSNDNVLDAGDAGTTLRFLVAYCCAANRRAIITGSDRMKQRPLKPLVDALLSLSFNIKYLAEEGFP